jgi:hypothetical protein
MIKKITIIYLLTLFSCTFAQQASDYFPSSLGFRWNFKDTPLDSANNEIDSMAFFRADSFAATSDYQGNLANIVLTKYGSLNILPILPYIDSSFYHFENTNADVYLQLAGFSYFQQIIDSLGIDTISNIVSIIESFKGWYTVYKFNSNVGSEYTIFTKDTTIMLGTTSFNVRLAYKGNRLNDETVQIPAGSFNCKKFVLTSSVDLLLGPFTYNIFSLDDSVWIANANWIVKDLIPSVSVDLSYLGYGSVTLPGLKTELIPIITSVEERTSPLITFKLDQNYPNPFNPSTVIKYSIVSDGFVSLNVYDILGREISSLVNKFQQAGTYSVNFNAGNATNGTSLSSGIYFYKLKVQGNSANQPTYSETKKMILIK